MASDEPFAIDDVGVVSMDSPTAFVASVLVRDGRIAYIGPARGITRTTGMRTVDGRGRFLIPGLIDMHTHVSKTRASSLAMLVAHGVTTARDLGGDHEELLRWRAEIGSSARVGPRLLIAGPYLESAKNAARQHATLPQEMAEPVERTRIGVPTPVDADRVVAAIAARGIDHVKIRTVENRESYLAIGAAARRHGLALFGHFQPFPVEDLIASGQRSIEHVFTPSWQRRPADERRAFFTRLAQAGIALVPTLVVVARLGDSDQALHEAVAGAERHGLAAFLRVDWREQLAEQGPDRLPFLTEVAADARRDFTEARQAGVRLLAGTDIGVLNVFPGRSLHEELALMVRELGMSPFEALRAATLHAAEFVRLGGELGSIAVGKRADMVLLGANPLEDISNVSRIDGVVLHGRLFDRPALDRLLADARSAPDVAANDWVRPGR